MTKIGNSAHLPKQRKQIKCFHIFGLFLAIAVMSSLVSYMPLWEENTPQPIATQEEKNRLLEEVAYHEDHQPKYHNTLTVDVDVASKSKLAKAEEIWSKSVAMRKEILESNKELKGSLDVTDLITYFPPTFNCPFNSERVGNFGEGGKWVCGLELFESNPECVFYSFGVSDHESSFESGLLNRTKHCQVFGYDFGHTKLGSEVDPFDSRVEFQSMGVGAENEDHVKTLRTLMAQNDHGWIDILKIDVGEEGLEILRQVMTDFDVLPFGQLQLTLTEYSERSFEEYYKWFESLESKGLRPFHAKMSQPACGSLGLSSIVLDYSYINLRGKHVLLSNYS